jgi:AraC-like DNA-binding protein
MADQMHIQLPVEADLVPFIREIIVQQTSCEPYVVLPSPFPILGFQWTGKLYTSHGLHDVPLSSGGIAGLQRNPRVFRADPHTKTLLVVFEPEGAFRLFGCAMDELFNTHAGLDDLLFPSWAHEIKERVQEAVSLKELTRTVHYFLRQVLHGNGRPGHYAVSAGVAAILKSNGSIRIEQIARHVGLSRRQLERAFRLEVGTTPKRFADLVRFSWTVTHFAGRPDMADLAYAAGYADQAHFIRNFSTFAGTTPTRLLNKKDDRLVMSHSFNTPGSRQSIIRV